MTGSEPTTEDMIRAYLQYLKDPEQLRDEELIAKQRSEAESILDPLAKLVALSELERLEVVDEEPLRKAFVAHAKAWADEKKVTLSAFQTMGVTVDVLRAAGYKLPRVPSSGDATHARPVPTTTTRRRGGRSREQLKELVRARKAGTTFTVRDIADEAGIPAANGISSAQRAIRALVIDGEVTDLGRDPNHAGKGAPPSVYALKST